MHVSLKSASALTAAQQHAMRETGLVMSHNAALHHLRSETTLARMQLHRIAGTSSPANAINGAMHAAVSDQAQHACPTGKQTGCNLNCSQGHRCTCSGSPIARLSPRPARVTPTHIEQRASDFGALDLTHQEHDATAGEVAENMTWRSTIVARIYRWGWRIALVAAAGILMAGCGGGDGSADEVRFTPAVFPASAMAAPAPAATAEIFGDSTLIRCYADQTGDAVAYAENTLRQKLLNASIGGSTAGSISSGRLAASPAPTVAMNWAINDSDTSTGEQYREILTRLSTTAAAAGKTVVLIESTPVVPGGSLSQHRSETKRLDFEAIKRQVSVATGAYYCAMPARQWTLADKPDGIHEHDNAAAWKGTVIADCLIRAAASI